MTRKDEFVHLFRDAFAEPGKWVAWLADNVYNDDDFLSVDEGSHRSASGLLLSPYATNFHGRELPSGYISCVATLREHRGKGLMHTLMHKAINTAARRGMALCSLIPASDRLYFLYNPMSFATVYYVDEQRYTSLHTFTDPHGYVPAEPAFEILHKLEKASDGAVLHTRRDFANILADLTFDGGSAFAVEGPEGSCAMAFMVPDPGGESVTVKYLGTTDQDAAEAVLCQVRREAGERRIVVWRSPGARPNGLRSRGMARIVDAAHILSVLAEQAPEIDQVIRVRDNIVAENNAVFILHKGTCTRVDDTMRRVTLDVEISVLTRILFSSPRIGDVFGIPTVRPHLPLMLD